ncbi:MAG: hypothetical protein ACI8RZ_008064, partial [Myxococcota bacterium]
MRHHLSGAQTVAGLYIGLLLAAILHPVGIAESLAERIPAARELIGPAQAWGAAVGIAGLKETLGGALGREVAAHVAEPTPEPVLVVAEAPIAATPAVPQRRVITPEAPLQLWIIGDSLLNLAGRELRKALTASGRVDADVSYRSSTGLVRPDYYDWPVKLSRRLSREPIPDAVLVMMGANDAQHMVVDGQKIERWSPEWVAEYTVRVEHMLSVMREAGCEVYWAGLPVMKLNRHVKTAEAVNAILSAKAETDAGVHYLPTDALFSGADGDYSRFLTDPDGRRFSARETDGVHFTMSGALWLVAHLTDRIDRDWGVFGPRRQDDGALTVPATQVDILRRDGVTAYVPDLGDPQARLPALYLLPGGWGEDWPGRADGALQALAAEHGVVLIATGEDADVDRWLAAEAGLPLIPDARAVAGLSTASVVGLVMGSHSERFASASRMSGVLDTLSPPWIRRPVMPDLDPPMLWVWRSSGEEWAEESVS